MTQPSTAPTEVPKTMRAAAIDRFGGPEELTLHTLPLPEIGANEVLLRVEVAGVGVWDPFEREGQMAEMMAGEPSFPYVLGSDGAGVVAAVGEQVSRFRAGDRVYAYGFLNPKGGFYAEYAAVAEDNVASVPNGLPLEQAGALPVDAMTALRGLDDTLELREGETVLIFGASGGVGHLAVQLAKRLGVRVLAVASGEDGVALAGRLGADAVVDGHGGDVAGSARTFAPGGLDALLALTGGEALWRALETVRDGGRVAYPEGVEPEPEARPEVEVSSYNGLPSREAIEHLNRLIDERPFEVHVARSYPLEEAAKAHRQLNEHFLGKLALKVR